MNKTRLWTLVAPLLAGALAAAGCGDHQEPQSPDVDIEEVEPSAERAVGHEGRRGHAKGPARLLKAALAELDLSADQRQKIEAIEHDLQPEEPGEMKELFSTLAEGVRRGAVDERAALTKIDEAAKGGAGKRAKLASALNELHAVLTPTQRAALATSVTEKMDAMAEKMAEKREGRDFAHGKEKKGALGRLLRGVELRDGQREQIQAALSKAGIEGPTFEEKMEAKAEMRSRMEAMVAAFPKDSFDAAHHLPEKADLHRGKLENLVKALAVAVPMLDEAQRAQLADELEKGPMHMGKHGEKGKLGRKEGKGRGR
jgi:Spy/CpxP family protein refolding chaperone